MRSFVYFGTEKLWADKYLPDPAGAPKRRLQREMAPHLLLRSVGSTPYLILLSGS